jgi:hypothetical protein
VWPFSERIDPRYKTVKTITFSGNYIFQPFTQVDPLYIRYSIIADIVDRDTFTIHELLKEEGQVKYTSTFIGCEIYQVLVPYHVHYEEDGYYTFHNIIDFGMKKMTISQENKGVNNLMLKIKENLCGQEFCGIKITDFIFISATRTTKPSKKQPLGGLKQMRGKYIDFETLRERGIKIHGTYRIKVAVVPTEDYIHIQWRYDKGFLSPFGYIKVYRREHSFTEDKLSETNNGDLIADNEELTYSFADEDLDKNIYYCYTFNLKHEIANSKGEYKTDHIARVRIKLKESKVEEVKEPEKSPIDELKEELEENRVKQKIKREDKREEIVVGLDAHIEDRKVADVYIDNYEKKLEADFKKEHEGRFGQKGRDYVKDIIDDLRDKANNMLSEIDDKE